MGGGRDKSGTAIYRRRNGVYERLDGQPINHRVKTQPEEKSFRDKINETSNYAEFIDVMRERYGRDPNIVRYSFARQNNLQMLKRVMNTIDDLEEKYPFMKGYIKGFRNIDDFKSKAMAGMDDEGNLYLNPNYWSENNNQYLYSMEKDVRGVHPPNMSPESIIAHEFGHAVHGYLMEKMADWANNAPVSEMLKAADVWAGLIDGTALEYIERKALNSLGLTHSLSMGRFKISKYAYGAKSSGGNPSYEAFAEAFADVYANGEKAGDVSKAYVQALLDEIKVYGG